MMISLIVRRCMKCHHILGFKNGQGVWGFSDGFCKPCFAEAMKGVPHE